MKKLKQLVRNVIDPERDLGHVDRQHNKQHLQQQQQPQQQQQGGSDGGDGGGGSTVLEKQNRTEGEKGEAEEEGCMSCD